MAALPIQTFISQGSSRTRTFNRLLAQYGDGYSQRAANGLNAIVDKWNVVYDNLSSANRTTVQDFVTLHGSWTYFTWTAPGDVAEKRWIIDGDVTETPKAGNLFSITIPIKQVYDL